MKRARQRKTGLAPGTILYTGKKTSLPVRLNYTAYTTDRLIEESYAQGQVKIHRSDTQILQWYDLQGLHDTELVRTLTEAYAMHPLAAESAVDVYKRPEFVPYEQGFFWSLKSVDFSLQSKELKVQHLAIYFGDHYLLSFQEHEDDIFEPLRQRIRTASTRIRSRKSDYLCYAIVDLVVDRYYHVADQLQEELEAIEETLNEDPQQLDKRQFFHLRKQLTHFRRVVFPLREGLSQFTRAESDLIETSTLPYIRDVYDHVIQIVEQIEVLRDTLNGLQDLYLSELSMQANQVMQLLTIITAIFVPITFLAGVYGMNFTYMPELDWPHAYFGVLGIMAVIALGMVVYFRRKGWL
ncbi:MAG: magnesium and cobalt transport protein CorA [Bacteroidetes bacterium]|nr:MAG: magnesium and cobalt transport protein CorA [Bacteroidota bacterium]